MFLRGSHLFFGFALFRSLSLNATNIYMCIICVCVLSTWEKTAVDLKSVYAVQLKKHLFLYGDELMCVLSLKYTTYKLNISTNAHIQNILYKNTVENYDFYFEVFADIYFLCILLNYI